MGFIVSLLVGRGLSELVAKIVVWLALVAIIFTVLIGVRQHYIDIGWNRAIESVKKQNDAAAEAADRVQQRTDKCNESNGFWDVVTQGCKFQEEEEER